MQTINEEAIGDQIREDETRAGASSVVLERKGRLAGI